MADTGIANFTDGVTANATDRIGAIRSPFGAGDDRYLTPAYVKDYMLALANTWTAQNIFAAGTITTSQPLTITQTVNAGAVNFVSFTQNITNTSSNSLFLADWKVGGTSVFQVRSDGRIDSNKSIILGSDSFLGWKATADQMNISTDLNFQKDAADIFAQYRSTNAQRHAIYNTRTSATNRELFAIDWQTVSNVCNLWTEKGSGGGTARELRLGTDGTGRWGIGATSGHLLPVADGTYDIGDGTNDPRKIYLDQTVTAGGTTGNQTINKAAGTVNFAGAASSLTVTNSLVTTNSTVLAVIRTNDGTATIKNVVPGSGSFVITFTAAATAETSVGFWVLN